jgi:hypothetical protein
MPSGVSRRHWRWCATGAIVAFPRACFSDDAPRLSGRRAAFAFPSIPRVPTCSLCVPCPSAPLRTVALPLSSLRLEATCAPAAPASRSVGRAEQQRAGPLRKLARAPMARIAASVVDTCCTHSVQRAGRAARVQSPTTAYSLYSFHTQRRALLHALVQTLWRLAL